MRRHELDVFSLITGLVFVAVATGNLLDETSDVTFDGRWVVPLVMVAIGVASLAGLARGRGREPRPAEASGSVGSTTAGATSPGTEAADVGDVGDVSDVSDLSDDTVVLSRDEPESR